jgi:hypothetical protein
VAGEINLFPHSIELTVSYQEPKSVRSMFEPCSSMLFGLRSLCLWMLVIYHSELRPGTIPDIGLV